MRLFDKLRNMLSSKPSSEHPEPVKMTATIPTYSRAAEGETAYEAPKPGKPTDLRSVIGEDNYRTAVLENGGTPQEITPSQDKGKERVHGNATAPDVVQNNRPVPYKLSDEDLAKAGGLRGVEPNRVPPLSDVFRAGVSELASTPSTSEPRRGLDLEADMKAFEETSPFFLGAPPRTKGRESENQQTELPIIMGAKKYEVPKQERFTVTPSRIKDTYKTSLLGEMEAAQQQAHDMESERAVKQVAQRTAWEATADPNFNPRLQDAAKDDNGEYYDLMPRNKAVIEEGRKKVEKQEIETIEESTKPAKQKATEEEAKKPAPPSRHDESLTQPVSPLKKEMDALDALLNGLNQPDPAPTAAPQPAAKLPPVSPSQKKQMDALDALLNELDQPAPAPTAVPQPAAKTNQELPKTPAEMSKSAGQEAKKEKTPEAGSDQHSSSHAKGRPGGGHSTDPREGQHKQSNPESAEQRSSRPHARKNSHDLKSEKGEEEKRFSRPPARKNSHDLKSEKGEEERRFSRPPAQDVKQHLNRNQELKEGVANVVSNLKDNLAEKKTYSPPPSRTPVGEQTTKLANESKNHGIGVGRA